MEILELKSINSNEKFFRAARQQIWTNKRKNQQTVDKSIQTMQAKEQREKSEEKMNPLREMWDILNCTHLRLTGVWGEDNETGAVRKRSESSDGSLLFH